jgi:excisionase family DNA binding protein
MSSIQIKPNSEPIKFQPSPSKSPETVKEISVTVEKAAKMLNLSESTVRMLVKQGKIPHTRLGNKIFFSPETLQQLVAGDPQVRQHTPEDIRRLARKTKLQEIMTEYYFVKELLSDYREESPIYQLLKNRLQFLKSEAIKHLDLRQQDCP